MLNFSDVTASPDERATENIEMRVKPCDKARILRAAGLTGVKLTTFVRAHRRPGKPNASCASIRPRRFWSGDRRTLLEALDNPPPPTRAARDAVRGYRSRIADAR